MKLVFVDEVHGSKGTGLFGVSILVVDSTKYNTLYEEFYSKLREHSWPLETEIKGKYTFARDPVNTGKTPTQMIALTRDLTSHLLSEKNSRGELFFVFTKRGYSLENYMQLVAAAFGKIQKPASQKNGKHLMACFLDDFPDLHANHPRVSQMLQESAGKRDYCLIDGAFSLVRSSNSSPGVVYADLLAYLARWVVENPDVEPGTLLDLVVPDTGAVNIQKTRVARELLEKIKGHIIEI